MGQEKKCIYVWKQKYYSSLVFHIQLHSSSGSSKFGILMRWRPTSLTQGKQQCENRGSQYSQIDIENIKWILILNFLYVGTDSSQIVESELLKCY